MNTSPLPQLSDAHWHMLTAESVINIERIKDRGYRTITDSRELAVLGFAPKQQITPGLLMPVYAPDGSVALHQYRPDAPRQKRNSKGELLPEVIKYETPKDASMRLDVPPICREMMANPSINLWITEGIKKADALASTGLCALALLGVWNFKGKNKFGGVTILGDFHLIAWNDRDVHIVFDSDIMHKRPVQLAMEQLKEILERKGAHVTAVYLSSNTNQKIGVDDFLREHSRDELEALIGIPRPVVQAAKPIFELLDEGPATMRRPLQIINGRAYAATWLYVQKSVTESIDERTGSIIKHNPPIKTVTRELYIIRDDGVIFGYGAPQAISDLGFEVILSEIPQDNRLMRTVVVTGYAEGNRASASEVFEKIRSVFDRFIDFERSLADQRTMSELTACYTLATWFLDAFNVAGYIWPTGERGSGKTQLLTLIAEMAYLGQVILASGTMPTLRDLADYGAFLGFDDAENLTNAKNSDPDKRTLLLAGNRRGNSVPVKEKTADGRGWHTRYVQTFSFRGFTATRTPDAILGSRTITIPLIRTPDRSKANADPLNFRIWPCNQQILIGELWMLALANLTKLLMLEDEVSQRASLTGRNLEPWRGILTVALWLENEGVCGIFERMNQLSVVYQTERNDLEGTDMTRLVLRSIVYCILHEAKEPIDVEELYQAGREWKLITKEIAEAAKNLIEEEELDFNLEHTNAWIIGKALGRLRFEKTKVGAKATRGWRIPISGLVRLLESFSLLHPSDTKQTSEMSETSETTCLDYLSSNAPDVSDISDVLDISDITEPIIDIKNNCELLEVFNERAAIAEFDGGLSRSEAESLALQELYDIAATHL
jgi:hypothetical protein